MENEEQQPTPAERVERVQTRLEAACAACGRDPAEVTVVAVSKKHPPESVDAVAAAGMTVFGENRVQEAGQKIPLCSGHLEWHLIGHLQTNKARAAAQLFSTIHSVDSLRLLNALDPAAGEAGGNLNIFLQVNVSGEGTKYGFAPDEVEAALDRATELHNLNVVGLMTMPPFTEDPEGAREHFVALRELRDRLRDATGFPLDALSMGMSHDFEVAVSEGATHIRVGTDLFGKRPPLRPAGESA